MKRTARIYRAAAALIAVASLVACGGGAGSVISGISGDSAQSKASQTSQRPAAAAHKSMPRRRMLNLGSTQPLTTGVMLQPLTLTVSGITATLSLFGTAQCGSPSGANPCPGVNFTGTPPEWMTASPAVLTLGATALNATCSAPAGTPTPAPGFVPACYIVAYEGGVGPYLVEGPAVASGGSLTFPAPSSTLNFNGNDTAYNFFLAYVTSVAATPPPPTPTPSPVPTFFSTPVPPTPTPTPSPTAKPTATPVFTPTPCPSSSGYRHDDFRRMDGGDDEESGCCSSYRDSRDAVRRYDHHRGGDDGCESGDGGSKHKGSERSRSQIHH